MIDPTIFHEVLVVKAVAGNEIQANCPFCEERGKSPDLKGHLYVNVYRGERGAAICFRCGYATRHLGGFLLDLDVDLSMGTARIVEVDLEKYATVRAVGANPVCFPDEIEPILPVTTSHQFMAQSYLKRRGFDDSAIIRHGFHCAGPRSERYAWRLIIPWFERGIPVYWSARALTDGGAKYVYPTKEEAPRGMSNCLFNVDNLMPGQRIVVTEGSFDAIASPQPATAIGGSEIRDWQVTRLVGARPSHVVAMLDGEARAENVALAVRLMQAGLDTRIALLPYGKDPPDLEPYQVGQLVEQALPMRNPATLARIYPWLGKIKPWMLR